MPDRRAHHDTTPAQRVPLPRTDATIASDMCPRCKSDNDDAWSLCRKCEPPATRLQRLADGHAAETRFARGYLELDDGEVADLRAVLAEHQAMLLTLWRMADDEPCDVDHNGHCQAHGLSLQPCTMAEARRLVGEWQPADDTN